MLSLLGIKFSFVLRVVIRETNGWQVRVSHLVITVLIMVLLCKLFLIV